MNTDNLNNNAMFVKMIKEMAADLGATKVLVGDKSYRFSLEDNKNLDIPKSDIEMEFLRFCNVTHVQ
jgi:hypothetical protein